MIQTMNKAVIVSASRTPIGRFLGVLSPLDAVALGSLSLRATLERAGLPWDVASSQIEEVILGQVVQAGSGQNPARHAAIKAGIPSSAGGLTINKVCGSGLKAVILAAQSILAGDQSAVLAGGMESMSNSPYLLPGARTGYKAGHQQVIDSNMQDGLWCSISNQGMGTTAERVQKKYEISREAQDQYALSSQQKAVAATESGAFAKEISAVEIAGKKGTVTVSVDEAPRKDSSLESLAKLRPAFEEGGTVTAGNAPGLNDGAASLLIMSQARALELGLKPLAEIVGYATGGLEPDWIMMTPVPATRKLLERLGWSASDVDLWELNEAFAVQAIAVMGELGLDSSKVNVHGGAVALGHPIGASGARILVTLLHALEHHNLETGVATLCMGGANGLALAVKRLG